MNPTPNLGVIQTASEIPDFIMPVGIHWDQNFTLLPVHQSHKWSLSGKALLKNN